MLATEACFPEWLAGSGTRKFASHSLPGLQNPSPNTKWQRASSTVTALCLGFAFCPMEGWGGGVGERGHVKVSDILTQMSDSFCSKESYANHKNELK